MTKPGILVIVFKGIGDVLMTTPLLRALKKMPGGARVYFLTRRPSAKILELNPNVDGVFFREDSPLLAIRRAGIDVTLDFMRSSVSGFYSLFSGASKRIAFRYPGGRLFYNSMQDKKAGPAYAAADRLEFLEQFGAQPDGTRPELYFRPANEEKAGAFLAANVPPGSPAVTFDITSPREHRRWPQRNFSMLADRLKREFGASVIFLSGPGETGYVTAAMGAAGEKHLFCPGFDLLDLAALQKRSALHVGLSSAPQHTAVSQGTPTFILYAPQNSPLSWSPAGPEHGWVQKDLSELSFDEAWGKLSAHMTKLGITKK